MSAVVRIFWLLSLGMFSCTAAPQEASGPEKKSDPAPVAVPEVTNGPMVIKGPDGRVRMEGNMRDDRRHGVWTSYHPDGTMQSRSAYVDGQLHGTTVVFHPNGQLYYTGEHRLDRQVGEWRFFDEEGVLVKTVTYDSTGTVINDR